MYVIQSGTVEVWSDPDGPGSDTAEKRKVAELNPGEMTGELAMLDQGLRTADLIAGPEGAEVHVGRPKPFSDGADATVLGRYPLKGAGDSELRSYR